jgi:hypothetical protein
VPDLRTPHLSGRARSRLVTFCLLLVAAWTFAGCGSGSPVLLSLQGTGGADRWATLTLRGSAYAAYSYDCSLLQDGAWDPSDNQPQGYFGVEATPVSHGHRVMLFSTRDAGGRSLDRPLPQQPGTYRIHVTSNCAWKLSIRSGRLGR